MTPFPLFHPAFGRYLDHSGNVIGNCLSCGQPGPVGYNCEHKCIQGICSLGVTGAFDPSPVFHGETIAVYAVVLSPCAGYGIDPYLFHSVVLVCSGSVPFGMYVMSAAPMYAHPTGIKRVMLSRNGPHWSLLHSFSRRHFLALPMYGGIRPPLLMTYPHPTRQNDVAAIADEDSRKGSL